jgi:DNA-directed RNA polymerase subunit RPC12/RpoP
MRKSLCRTCNKETDWLTLVDNSYSYQTTYDECTGCGHRIVTGKTPITRDDDIRLGGTKRY